MKREVNANQMSLSLPDSFLLLNNPDNTHNFVQELPRSFHDKKSDSGCVKYDFNIRMIIRLPNPLNIIEISKIYDKSYTKMKK